MQSHAPSAIPSPPQIPHSSNSNSEPHILSHPVGADSPQPQPKSILPSQSHDPSAIPSPLHSPHSSTIASPPHSLLQSAYKHVPLSTFALGS